MFDKVKKTRFFAVLGLVCLATLFVVLKFFHTSSQLIQIPLKTTSAGTPSMVTEIGKEKYTLAFDLGSKFLLSLSKNVLDSITNKTLHETVQWRDVQGKTYEGPSYLIPQISIDGLILNNVVAKQEDDSFTSNTTLWDDNKEVFIDERSGTLGRQLLDKTNILIDFPHATMFASNNKTALKKAGFFLDKMVPIPFETGPKGIIILNVNTDAGILHLALDTGATITIVRSSRVQDQTCIKNDRGFFDFITSRFSIGNNDFGKQRLLLYDITPELKEIDGLLGMDFLKHHVLYIDYQNKILYLDPPLNNR
jgi:hypothetical protein